MKVEDPLEGEPVNGDEFGSQNQSLVSTTAGALSHADMMTQVDIAKRYPRNLTKFMHDLQRLVTAKQEIAESCFYVLKRKDNRTGEVKRIEGRSIRFAEIAAGCFTNVRYGARGVDVGDRFVTVHGAAIDLESNVGVEAPVTRRITTSKGARYGDDMIGVTIAATSIAMRNVTLRIIPMAYTEEAYEAAKQTAIGDAKSLADRRQKILARFAQMGVTVEEILVFTERPSVDFINLDDLQDLIGLGTAIKEGTQSIDEAFNRGPKPSDQPTGKSGFGFKKAEETKKEASTDPPKASDPTTGQPATSGGAMSEDASLEAEARAREQQEAAQAQAGPSPTDNREALLKEISQLEDQRKMRAADRSGLWKQHCGTATQDKADLMALIRLRDHLRIMVGGQQQPLV